MAFTISAARADFRIYYIVGNILGFILYHYTIGNIVTGIFLKISSFVRKIFKAFTKIISHITNFFVKSFTLRLKKGPAKVKKY